jgi:parvulin-like peptidyl-prolyl isomerase
LAWQAHVIELVTDRGEDLQEIVARLPQTVLRRGCNSLNSIAGFYPFAHDESLSPNSVEGAGRGDVVL